MEYLERIKKEIKERIQKRLKRVIDSSEGMAEELESATDRQMRELSCANSTQTMLDTAQTVELLKIQVEQNARIIRLLETKR